VLLSLKKKRCYLFEHNIYSCFGSQAELVHALEFGLVTKSSRACIRALTVCAYDMRVAVMRQLPSLLLKLSQIHSTVSMAIPLMEFLSSQ